MPAEQLERLFVARERTLETVMANVTDAATGSGRNHALLVGPRGSGKTHLVALAYHRAKALRDSGMRLQLAWLPEDPWTIVSYRHLLSAIAERLEPPVERPIPTSVDELELLLGPQAAAGGPIVVLIENLDQILDAIGDLGQQQLRHVLQADRSLLLIATTTQLDRSLSDQASPFYGFFTTTRLQPFDVAEAVAMLAAIAAENNDDGLVNYLDSQQGRSRLRTIEHLAGGQPRIWAILANALTLDGLSELVDLLLTRFDDLTPYYQEQLARLSPQQRLIVAELAGEDRPINVTELSSRTHIEQRSLARTIGELQERGWLRPTNSALTALLDRRRTYYELAEPLARLAFQIKETRGEPLRLIVEFLKHWFDPVQLAGTAVEPFAEYLAQASAGQVTDPVVSVVRRLRQLPATHAPTINLLGRLDDALAALAAENPDRLLHLQTPIRTALEARVAEEGLSATRASVHDAAFAQLGYNPQPLMTEWIARAENWVRSTEGADQTEARLFLSSWLARAWQFDQAEILQDVAIAALEPDNPDIFIVRNNLALAYAESGQLDRAIALDEQNLADRTRVLGPDNPDTLTTLGNLACLYTDVGRLDEGIPLLEQVLAERKRVLAPDDPNILTSRNNLAYAYDQAGEVDRAIEVHEQNLADSTRVLGPHDPRTLTALNNLAYVYGNAGQRDRARELFEQALAARERVLGADHPDTATSRNNLAQVYAEAGYLYEAIKLHERNVADNTRLLGPDHRNTLTSRNNLASVYMKIGRLDEAITLLQQTLADKERVLGHDHKDTNISRTALTIAYITAGDLDRAHALQGGTRVSERTLTPIITEPASE